MGRERGCLVFGHRMSLASEPAIEGERMSANASSLGEEMREGGANEEGAPAIQSVDPERAAPRPCGGRNLRVVRPPSPKGSHSWKVISCRTSGRPIGVADAEHVRPPARQLPPQRHASLLEAALDPEGGCPEEDSPRVAGARQVRVTIRAGSCIRGAVPMKGRCGT